MMRILRLAAAAFLAALAVALPARATTYSTDFTDLWYIPAESGWGLNLIQQNQTMFGTLFVYDTTTAPHWYVASDLEPTSNGNTTAWSGTLYSTTGPYFGASSFNPNNVVNTVVGTINITFTSDSTASLLYSVNGAIVTKNIQRQSFRNNVLTGNYLGGLTATGSNCHNGVSNGSILVFELLSVTHTNPQDVAQSAVQMSVDFNPNQSGVTQSRCVFSGGYTQTGRLGGIPNGNWNCVVNGQSANVGTFTMTQIDASTSGFNAKFHGSDQFCNYDGQFGGIRDVPQ